MSKTNCNSNSCSMLLASHIPLLNLFEECSLATSISQLDWTGREVLNHDLAVGSGERWCARYH